MLAWLSWALGQSTRATAFLAELVDEELDHPLAATVGSLIRQGHLPAWAFCSTPGTHDGVAAPSDQPAA
jgi:hypothetical protein